MPLALLSAVSVVLFVAMRLAVRLAALVTMTMIVAVIMVMPVFGMGVGVCRHGREGSAAAEADERLTRATSWKVPSLQSRAFPIPQAIHPRDPP